MKRIRKAKLFVFLRQHRHELLDEAFQQELATLYREAERGQPPVAPAMLALALILEAYTGVSDNEVIEATVMDRRWQLVLDCVDTQEAPFSKGTLVAFRQRLIEGQMDQWLIERTIESELLDVERWPASSWSGLSMQKKQDRLFLFLRPPALLADAPSTDASAF